MFVRHGFWCGLTLATIWACSPASGPRAAEPDTRSKAAGAAEPGPPPKVIHLPSGSVGPFLMPAPSGWVGAWASPMGDALNWHTATFGQDGLPSAEPRRLMEAPTGLTTLRLRAINPQRGLVVGAFESEDSEPDAPTYGLSTLVVSSAGTMLSGNATLVEECDPIVWIEIVPLGDEVFVAWAEDVDDHAEIFAAVVNLDGHRQTDVFTLHNKARAWQMVRHSQGAMLGVVTSDGGVDVVSVAANGQPRPAQVLLDGRSAESDIDLAATGDRVLVAFSDRRSLEPQLYAAWVSLDASLRSVPKPVIPPSGATALVGLRGTPSGPLLLWQNTAQEPEVVRAGLIDNEGRLTGTPLQLKLPPPEDAANAHDLLMPQVETTSAGVLVMQPPCTGSRECKGHADVLELNAALEPQSRLSWSERSHADLVWDFQCASVNCAALAASFGSRTAIRVLTTAAAKRAMVDTHKASPPPTVAADVEAILRSDELADLDAATLGSGTLITSLTAFDPNTPYEIPATPAPDGRLAPVQAQLKTFWFPDAPATSTSDPRTPAVETSISIRARSVAGVELTQSGNQALLLWTAIDNLKPQVFATSLDVQGRKQKQNMLTRQTGEVLALGAATSHDGTHYAGWVREEGSRNKAYVAHLGANLIRQSLDVAVADTTGAISDIDLAVTPSGVWAVIAKTDGGGSSSTLDWQRLHPFTLQSKGPAPNPVPAREKVAQYSPRLVLWNGGLALAWLEREGDASRVKLARLNANGELVREFSASLPGEPATINLDCTSECRIAIAGELADEPHGYLALVAIPAEAPEQFVPEAKVVARNLAAASTQVRPAVSQRDAYYFDLEPNAAHGLVREVHWSSSN